MVDRALDQFMGVTLETGRDLLKENETGWRERPEPGPERGF